MEIRLLGICEVLAEVLQIDKTIVEKLNITDNLKDYGLDSIHAIQLIVFLEEKYNIEFDDDDLLFENYDTLEKLIKLLEKYLNQ